MAMSQQLAGSLSKKMLTLEGKTKLLVSNKERKKEKLLTSENLTATAKMIEIELPSARSTNFSRET